MDRITHFGSFGYAAIVAIQRSHLACHRPIAFLMGLFILMDGIELYFTSPHRKLSPRAFKQEMAWLFGDDWKNIAGGQEYMLGQERIRRRQIRSAQFNLHLCISLIYNALT